MPPFGRQLSSARAARSVEAFIFTYLVIQSPCLPVKDEAQLVNCNESTGMYRMVIFMRFCGEEPRWKTLFMGLTRVIIHLAVCIVGLNNCPHRPGLQLDCFV